MQHPERSRIIYSRTTFWVHFKHDFIQEYSEIFTKNPNDFEGLEEFYHLDQAKNDISKLQGLLYYKTEVKWRRFITCMICMKTIKKHSNCLRKSNGMFKNSKIKQLNSSETIIKH